MRLLMQSVPFTEDMENRLDISEHPKSYIHLPLPNNAAHRFRVSCFFAFWLGYICFIGIY